MKENLSFSPPPPLLLPHRLLSPCPPPLTRRRETGNRCRKEGAGKVFKTTWICITGAKIIWSALSLSSLKLWRESPICYSVSRSKISWARSGSMDGSGFSLNLKNCQRKTLYDTKHPSFTVFPGNLVFVQYSIRFHLLCAIQMTEEKFSCISVVGKYFFFSTLVCSESVCFFCSQEAF